MAKGADKDQERYIAQAATVGLLAALSGWCLTAAPALAREQSHHRHHHRRHHRRRIGHRRASDALAPGQVLRAGADRVSRDRRYSLVMQSDVNLMMYAANRVGI
jgi:hypothetical protein